MAETIIDLKGNVIVADEFRGEVTPDPVDPDDIAIPKVNVAGTEVGPGSLTAVIGELITLINTKADS